MEHIKKVRSRTMVRAMIAATVAGYAIVAAATTQVATDRTIIQIGAYGNVGYVYFAPSIPNLEGCPYANGDEVIIDWTTDPNAKAMYATVLAAYVAGHKVGFGVSGCYAGGAPLVYRVDVKP